MSQCRLRLAAKKCSNRVYVFKLHVSSLNEHVFYRQIGRDIILFCFLSLLMSSDAMPALSNSKMFRSNLLTVHVSSMNEYVLTLP